MHAQQKLSGDGAWDAVCSNLKAAELHEAVARLHRAAADHYQRRDGGEALGWVTRAHRRCNDAFDATITAHWISADVTPLEPED